MPMETVACCLCRCSCSWRRAYLLAMLHTGSSSCRRSLTCCRCRWRCCCCCCRCWLSLLLLLHCLRNRCSLRLALAQVPLCPARCSFMHLAQHRNSYSISPAASPPPPPPTSSLPASTSAACGAAGDCGELGGVNVEYFGSSRNSSWAAAAAIAAGVHSADADVVVVDVVVVVVAVPAAVVAAVALLLLTGMRMYVFLVFFSMWLSPLSTASSAVSLPPPPPPAPAPAVAPLPASMELSMLKPLSSSIKVPSDGKMRRPSAAALTSSRRAWTCFSVTFPCSCMPCRAKAVGLLLTELGSVHHTTGMVVILDYTTTNTLTPTQHSRCRSTFDAMFKSLFKLFLLFFSLSFLFCFSFSLFNRCKCWAGKKLFRRNEKLFFRYLLKGVFKWLTLAL